MRLLGKRGVRPLSVFELVVIISLGSVADDPMLYKETGLLVPVIVFAVIVVDYRLSAYRMSKSKKLDELIGGKCVHLSKNGVFSIDDFGKEGLLDEFFPELRQELNNPI